MANSLQHNWESVFFDTYNKIIEDNILNRTLCQGHF